MMEVRRFKFVFVNSQNENIGLCTRSSQRFGLEHVISSDKLRPKCTEPSDIFEDESNFICLEVESCDPMDPPR